MSFSAIPDGTYPQVVQHSPSDIELFFRNSAMDWVSIRSRDGGQTWSSPVVAWDETGRRGFYASFSAGPNGEVVSAATAIEWDLYLSGSAWGRRNLYVMRRDVGGVWRDADGVPAPAPITNAEADQQLLVYSSGSANVNNPQPAIAPNGDVCVAFITGSGGGPNSYTYRFMRWDGEGWRSSVIGQTDHFFDIVQFEFTADGSVRAYTIEGGSPGTGITDRQYGDDGGLLYGRISSDGRSWPSAGTLISPDEPGTIYHCPTPVLGSGGDGAVVFTDWMNGPHHFSLRLYMRTDEGLAQREYEPHATRLAGDNRIKTAVAVSQQAFPIGAEAVVLANSEQFADALTGGPLAATLGGPVLLTSPRALHSSTASEIRRLKPKRIVLLGGNAALSDAVRSAADRLQTGDTVERLAGSNRYETAERIARRMRAAGTQFDTAFVASGAEFADSAAASGWAGFRGRPILLTGPGSTAPAARAITSLGVTRTIVLGGQSAVPPWIAAQLPSPTRLSGADRYTTAARIAKASLADGMLTDRIMLASGAGFADSLTGGVLAARFRAPTVLATARSLPAESERFISGLRGEAVRCYVIGGHSAISSAVQQRAMGALEP